jgi:hypothetical protein
MSSDFHHVHLKKGPANGPIMVNSSAMDRALERNVLSRLLKPVFVRTTNPGCPKAKYLKEQNILRNGLMQHVALQISLRMNLSELSDTNDYEGIYNFFVFDNIQR